MTGMLFWMAVFSFSMTNQQGDGVAVEVRELDGALPRDE